MLLDLTLCDLEGQSLNVKTRTGQSLASSHHKIWSNIGKYSWMTFIFGKRLPLVIIHPGESFQYNMPFRSTYKKKCKKLYSVQ